jgi:hypothetical protein
MAWGSTQEALWVMLDRLTPQKFRAPAGQMAIGRRVWSFTTSAAVQTSF